MRLFNIGRAAAMGIACAMAAAAGAAAEEDNTRSVRIIDGPAGTAIQEAPASPSPAIVDPAPLKADNAAGLALEILPGTELPAGTRISLRVATRRPGYLVLLDVNAEGKLSQIYPNRGTLLSPGGGREQSNRITPGKPVVIPDMANPYAGFTLLAAPPAGVAMVVAILSDRPVQVFDLPDVPAHLAGRAEALKYLTDAAGTLRVASTTKAGQFDRPQLSFDAKFYLIR